MSVLTGPGAIAASLALAACAGWWRARSGSEHERRSQLRSWVNSAADQASGAFGEEMTRRVGAVQQHLDRVLPGLLDAQRTELDRVRRELREFRDADAEARRAACSNLTKHRAAAQPGAAVPAPGRLPPPPATVARDLLQALAEDATSVALAATTIS